MGTARRVYEYGGQLSTGGLIQCAVESGGTKISGASTLFMIRLTNISGNAPMWVGSNGLGTSPCSGTGGILYPGTSMEIRLDSTANVFVCAENSGNKVSWLGMVRQQ